MTLLCVSSDGVFGLNVQWVPDTASQTNYAALITLASSSRCVLIRTRCFSEINVDGDWMLDLPASLWNMLVNDNYTYIVWKCEPQRRKLLDTFELNADHISIIDVEVKRPELASHT